MRNEKKASVIAGLTRNLINNAYNSGDCGSEAAMTIGDTVDEMTDDKWQIRNDKLERHGH